MGGASSVPAAAVALDYESDTSTPSEYMDAESGSEEDSSQPAMNLQLMSRSGRSASVVTCGRTVSEASSHDAGSLMVNFDAQESEERNGGEEEQCHGGRGGDLDIHRKDGASEDLEESFGSETLTDVTSRSLLSESEFQYVSSKAVNLSSGSVDIDNGRMESEGQETTGSSSLSLPGPGSDVVVIDITDHDNLAGGNDKVDVMNDVNAMDDVRQPNVILTRCLTEVSPSPQNVEQKETTAEGSVSDLPAHIKYTFGTYGPVYQCICGKAFASKQNVGYHKNCDGSEKEYKCPHCVKQFSVKCHFDVHLRQAHGGAVYKCDVCGKTFRRKNRFVTHMRQHTGERPYACKDCDLKFVSRDLLRFHSYKHVPPQHICTLCEKTFISGRNLERHMRTHAASSNLVCEQCGRKFTGKYFLDDHMVKYHPKMEFDPVTQELRPIYDHQCTHPQCRKILHNAEQLRKHEELHARFPDVEGLLKNFVCEVCGKAFTRAANYRRHAMSSHQKKKYRKINQRFQIPSQ